VSGAGGSRTVATGGAAHGGSRLVPVIHVGVGTRVKLVQDIGLVRTGVGGVMSGAGGTSAIAAMRATHSRSRIVAVIHVGVNQRISLVSNV